MATESNSDKYYRQKYENILKLLGGKSNIIQVKTEFKKKTKNLSVTFFLSDLSLVKNEFIQNY